MTQDDLIHIALEVGLVKVVEQRADGTKTIQLLHPQQLTRFAALIEAKVKDDLLAGAGEPVAWIHQSGHVQVRAPYLSADAINRYSTNGQWTILYTADQLAAAVLREREECARLCDELAQANLEELFDSTWLQEECAERIRARGSKT